MGYFRTATKFSRTTSKHINKWIGSANANTIDQKALEDMLGWNA
jgi:hypothetical protein